MLVPYPFQEECLESLRMARSEGKDEALVVMATGLGKTAVVAFDVERFHREHPVGRVLYICHRTEILRQAQQAFVSQFGETKTYGFFHGTEKNFHEVDCLFSTFDTMKGWLDVFDPGEFQYMVVDESHHSQADTWVDCIKYFKPKFLLGVTATPDRIDQKDIRDIYGEPVFDLPLEKALTLGYLTPVDYRVLTDEIHAEKLIETPQGPYSMSALNRRLFVPKRDEEIARIIASHSEKVANPKTIIFCSSVAYCDHLTTFMPNSLPIHSGIPEKERGVRLEMFRQGLLDTIITVDCFNEGIDIPRANIIVFLRTTASRTIFLQQLGRGLRKCEDKDKVLVLDFVGNVERIKLIKELDDAVRNLRKNVISLSESAADPFMLEWGKISFEEQEVPLSKLLARVLPKMVAEEPELVAEFSGDNILTPDKVPVGSGRKYRWVCKTCAHSWLATPKSRYQVEGTTCPGCLGDVITDKNNLSVTHPLLAKEYSPDNEFSVDKVFAGTWAVVKWNCSSCGHEWACRSQRRVHNDPGCPECGYQIQNPASKTRAQALADFEETRKRLQAEHEEWVKKDKKEQLGMVLRREITRQAMLGQLGAKMEGGRVTVSIKRQTIACRRGQRVKVSPPAPPNPPPSEGNPS